MQGFKFWPCYPRRSTPVGADTNSELDSSLRLLQCSPAFAISRFRIFFPTPPPPQGTFYVYKVILPKIAPLSAGFLSFFVLTFPYLAPFYGLSAPLHRSCPAQLNLAVRSVRDFAFSLLNVFSPPAFLRQGPVFTGPRMPLSHKPITWVPVGQDGHVPTPPGPSRFFAPVSLRGVPSGLARVSWFSCEFPCRRQACYPDQLYRLATFCLLFLSFGRGSPIEW